MKKFTSVNDISNVDDFVKKALFYKANPYVDKNLGSNKKLGCIFLNPSLRTRLSTQIAAQNLGISTIVLNANLEGWNIEFDDNAVMDGTTVEHIKDAAPILGNYFDVLAIRTFAGLKNKDEDYEEKILNQFMKYAKIPIVSLESATLHPLQSFADLITITEELNNLKKSKPKIVLSWAPHVKALPHAVANSFSEWILKWGKSDFVITHPEGYELDRKFTGDAKIVFNQDEAIKDADIIYVKNWSSYKNYGELISVKEDWMLTNKKLEKSNNAKIMHCLPTRRNVEIASEVLDGQNSLITKQASNRVWSAQTIISEILKQNG